MKPSSILSVRAPLSPLTLPRLLVAAAALVAGAAQAQVPGTMSIKLGVNTITPHVSSGDLSAPALPGSQIDVKSASAPIITAAYQFTDAVSMEVFAGLPYKHEVVGAGAIAGVGRLGSIQQVSPTILMQYRLLNPTERFRPYVGAGLTYAMFFGAEGSGTLTALTNPGGSPTLIGDDKSLGFSAQLGGTLRLDNHWFLDLSLIKTWIDTTVPVETAPVNHSQTIQAKLDPTSINLSVGYRF